MLYEVITFAGLDKSVRQGWFPMINVGDDAEVSDVVHTIYVIIIFSWLAYQDDAVNFIILLSISEIGNVA